MSTAVAFNPPIDNGWSLDNPEDTPIVHSSTRRFTLPEGIDRSLRKPRKSKVADPVRTIRRFKGFLIETEGEDARVALIENGERFLYDLPSEQLRKAGITLRNQPFEMDEVEVTTDDGGLIVGYKFKPLAERQHAYTEALRTDDERKRKRDLILKEFAKPKH